MEKLNKVLRTSQMAEIDRYTIENEPISSLDLMERAARIWTEAFCKVFGSRQQIVVVAGNGNNGGDGYAIARLLAEKGKEVVVWRVIVGGKMSPDCEVNYRRWLALGRVVLQKPVWPEGGVVIDALFGSGLDRPVTGVAAEAVRAVNVSGCTVVAVDMPSGLMGEDNAGNDPEGIVRAACTFTFQFPKVAFFLAGNAVYVGRWSVLDIGLHPSGIEAAETACYYVTAETARALLPRPEKFAHKGTNGRGLLIAGSYGMMGAAVLAARAAVRSGIGLLYCHVPEKGGEIMQVAVPEAILDRDVAEERFTAVRGLENYDAVALGPAIGRGTDTALGVREVLACWQGVTILDADALNILSEHRECLALLHKNCILTPHVKEFERLAGKSKNDFDRLNKLSIFARQYQVHLVLKGAYSVVALPDGRLFFNMSGNPGMAKGGAGDVLTGVLLGLAASRMKLPDLLIAGVFAHGLSGDLLVKEQGCRGICAGMIAEGMGKAWRCLENLEDE